MDLVVIGKTSADLPSCPTVVMLLQHFPSWAQGAKMEFQGVAAAVEAVVGGRGLTVADQMVDLEWVGEMWDH